jgi:hypothetical protein
VIFEEMTYYHILKMLDGKKDRLDNGSLRKGYEGEYWP